MSKNTLICLFFLLQPAGAAEWLYSESVVYQENHDPGIIWLSDGRKIQVEYSQIKWEEVETWNPGKKLLLAFSKRTGAVLHDPDSKRQVPALNGFESHPIDRILEQRMEAHGSTQGMVDALNHCTGLWSEELSRVENALLDSVPVNQHSIHRKAFAAWQKFRAAQVQSLGTLYSNRDGTIWRIVLARHVYAMTKQQALRIDAIRNW